MRQVSQRIKRAVALAVHSHRHPGLVLAVKRPETSGEELPGLWGLPATSLRPGETPEKGARRAAREKLGLDVAVGRALGSDRQPRRTYILHMTVFEAEVGERQPHLPEAPAPASATYYTDWQWADPSLLQEAAQEGSLCSQVYLKAQHK